MGHALDKGIDGAAGGGIGNGQRDRLDIEDAGDQGEGAALIDVVEADIDQIDLAYQLALDSGLPLLVAHLAKGGVFAIAGGIDHRIEGAHVLVEPLDGLSAGDIHLKITPLAGAAGGDDVVLAQTAEGGLPHFPLSTNQNDSFHR